MKREDYKYAMGVAPPTHTMRVATKPHTMLPYWDCDWLRENATHYIKSLSSVKVLIMGSKIGFQKGQMIMKNPDQIVLLVVLFCSAFRPEALTDCGRSGSLAN